MYESEYLKHMTLYANKKHCVVGTEMAMLMENSYVVTIEEKAVHWTNSE